MVLSTILQKGHSLGEDSAQVALAVEQHFTPLMSKAMNKDGGTYSWSEHLESMVTHWGKLAIGFKDTVPETEISFKDLNSALTKIFESGELPAQIEDK